MFLFCETRVICTWKHLKCLFYLLQFNSALFLILSLTFLKDDQGWYIFFCPASVISLFNKVYTESCTKGKWFDTSSSESWDQRTELFSDRLIDYQVNIFVFSASTKKLKKNRDEECYFNIPPNFVTLRCQEHLNIYWLDLELSLLGSYSTHCLLIHRSIWDVQLIIVLKFFKFLVLSGSERCPSLWCCLHCFPTEHHS